MNKKLGKNFVKILSVAIATCSLSFVCNISNAATRTAVRGTPVSRKPVTNTQSVTTQTAATVVETASEPVETIAEPEIFENKSSQFGDILSGTISGDDGIDTSDLAEQIRKQRAAADARDNIDMAQTNLQNSLRSGKNACDSGLRQCMQKTCGEDFTKCATDGDTIFGDKLNKCRRDTNCTGEEFNLFTAEIKADRDMNFQLASYNAVINCGNNYNACIQNECGATFTKCLGKTAADAAIKKCATIAKNCTQQDSGLAARFGKVIGELRGVAEKDVKTDEARMYELRKLMRPVCEKLGAMFDERSFDCVYTVNFFAGDNQTTPTASRKLYAGDTFFCNQEWFGVNATTYKENAYRETRAQTAASSAMLGSGVGTAVGLVTSGAIGRALNTQNAKKALDAEKESQNSETTNSVNNKQAKQDKNTEDERKEQKSETDKPPFNAYEAGRNLLTSNPELQTNLQQILNAETNVVDEKKIINNPDTVSTKDPKAISTNTVTETVSMPETKESYSTLTALQDITEPTTDPNEWTLDTYEQCLTNFNDYKGSSNVKAFWAKSNNGKYCNGYSGGKYLYDRKKNPNTCSQNNFKSLNDGEWKVTLKNGKSITGIARCSDTPGVKDEIRDNIEENRTGTNCWCKITKSDLTDCATTQKFSWDFIPYRWIEYIDQDIEDPDKDMPDAYYKVGGSTCPWMCAYECGYNMLDYGTDRQRRMHGVPYINEYHENLQNEYKKHIAEAYGIS